MTSLVIGAGYHGVTVATANGQVITDAIVEGSPQRVVLKRKAARSSLCRKRGTLSVSRVFMPDDVEKQLQPQEIIDLAYITLDKTADRSNGTPHSRDAGSKVSVDTQGSRCGTVEDRAATIKHFVMRARKSRHFGSAIS
ncbi:MAG: hypothetical protein U0744_19610 [Gemmataceae bacterium]